MTAAWQADLDLDWAIELLLLDQPSTSCAPLAEPGTTCAPPRADTDRCGSCGSSLYTNGTCPLCDRRPT